jgi:hypothetical protein
MDYQEMKAAGWVYAPAWLPPDLARRLHRVAPPHRTGRRAGRDNTGRAGFIRRAIENELARIEGADDADSSAV